MKQARRKKHTDAYQSLTPKKRPASRRAAGPSAVPFIVGIGASAGGLQALQAFFQAMPGPLDAAFVVVQHLSPDFKSFMVELLAKHTRMRVQRAEHGAPVQSGNVYLIPPKTTLTIAGGCLQLQKTDPHRGLHLPIDEFFVSLAEDQQHRAIAIVLSGTGSDGTAGIRAVKDVGGVVLVQSEDSAQFDGMPRSAISTGLADYVLPPDKLAAQLAAYVAHPALEKSKAIAGRQVRGNEALMGETLGLLRNHCGVDFTHYKAATMDRRIERRMNVCQIPTMSDYVRHLSQSPREVALLFNELLINVTSFFRDRPAWDTLAKNVVPALLKRLPPGEPFRAWVAGCSTGEEAYSLAIVVAEQMDKLKLHRPVKIFATDIAKEALATGARGIYPTAAMAGVSAGRRQQFFIKENSGYKVRARLREMVVFANHNVLADPPFTRLSLISCRNLLIYLQPTMQQRLLSLFSFALVEAGILFLGSSESVGDATDRFHALATRANLYRNRHVNHPPPPLGAGAARITRPGGDSSPALRRAVARVTIGEVPSVEEIYHRVVDEFAPACLVVDSRDEVLHVIGSGGDYLKHPPGGFTRNIFKLTSHNLANALRSALIRAQQKSDTFTQTNVRYKEGRKLKSVTLHVRPLHDKAGQPTGVRLILIQPARLPVAAAGKRPPAEDAQVQRIGDLERDLSMTRDTLQATVQDLETSNEEIQAANEELLAANEELQSTNEELQSVNEELHTVNAENQSRIEELTALTNDINNLLATASVGVLLVDAQLRVRRASRSALAALNLTDADIGVPIETIGRVLRMPDLPVIAERVMKAGRAEEKTVEATGAWRWLLLRLVPFRNEMEHTDGVVLSLIDLSERHEAEKRLVSQAAITQSVIDTMGGSVAVVDRDGRILHVNNAWRTSEAGAPIPAPGSLAVGANYLDACAEAERAGAATASEAIVGIRKVIRGELTRFSYDYAVDGPRGPDWFRLHVVPLSPADTGLAVAHFNITPKQAADAQGARSPA